MPEKASREGRRAARQLGRFTKRRGFDAVAQHQGRCALCKYFPGHANICPIPRLFLERNGHKRYLLTTRKPRQCVWLAEKILPQNFHFGPRKGLGKESRQVNFIIGYPTRRIRKIKDPFLIKTHFLKLFRGFHRISVE